MPPSAAVQNNHHVKIESSYKLLKTIRGQDVSTEELIYELHRLDPFLFEELILSAIEQLGHEVIRGVRYSGDGGVDGRVLIHGERFIIQAKRYQGHINAVHMREFARLCVFNNVRGLFVHTGRAGALSRTYASSSANHVTELSGRHLKDLLVGRAPHMSPFLSPPLGQRFVTFIKSTLAA